MRLHRKAGRSREEGQPESDSDFHCLLDTVKNIKYMLEQIFDHQTDERSEISAGYRVRMSPWKQLEGFDFMDLPPSPIPSGLGPQRFVEAVRAGSDSRERFTPSHSLERDSASSSNPSAAVLQTNVRNVAGMAKFPPNMMCSLYPSPNSSKLFSGAAPSRAHPGD
jgi:hypothetical protein